MAINLEHCPFRLTPKMRVLDVKSNLLINTLPNVSKDGLFDKIKGSVIHFDSRHAHHGVLGLLPALVFRLAFGV